MGLIVAIKQYRSIPNTSENFVASSLMDICSYRATHQPNEIAYRFLDNGIDESAILTYRSLHNQAWSIANELFSCDGESNSALLLYPPGIHYIIAFFACLYARVIAIPSYQIMSQTDQQRIKGIIKDASPSIILTDQKNFSSTQDWLASEGLAASIRCLATDTLEKNNAPVASIDNKNEIAFLQYTSGSTGNPKGVMVGHDNLLHNLQQIYKGFEHNNNTSGVIWLPPYHDMGLIGGILQPLYGGFTVNLMSPMTFLRRPIRWLLAIDKYRATTSGGPNFAYDLCIKYATDKNISKLDLSCWEVAFTGAETIRAKTLSDFFDSYKKCGFQYNAYYPCYGLAESSLMVTGINKKSKPKIIHTTQECIQKGVIDPHCDNSNISFVGSGIALDAEVKVIDTESLTINSDYKIGEIWVKSPSVAKGYWNDTKQSQSVFNAYTQDKKGSYLRTGDLGFFVESELYVTGRLKELIIINGRNFIPNDIEDIVQASHSALRKGCGTAFSIDINGYEKLVVVQELERKKERLANRQDIETKIADAVVTYYKIVTFDIVLVKQSILPKTTSGKLKRLEIKRRYLAGEFKK